MIYAPKEYHLPRFLSTRLKQIPNNEKLIKYMQKQSIYKKCAPKPKEVSKKTEIKCKEHKVVTANRSLISETKYHLPPNRYNPKSIEKKPNGEMGSYWSKIQRKPETIIHHKAHTKYLGTHRFYEHTRNTERCDKDKNILLTNPRERKATARFMVNDPILCYHNPNDPGPANYNPLNYTIKNKIGPKRSAKKLLIYKFLKNSIVASKDTYIDQFTKGLLPGPGRFNPVSVIAPPVKHCIYDPDMAYRAEVENINKLRHLPYKKINMNFCEDTRIRVIPGHGHTYRFRGEENWKPDDKQGGKKSSSKSNAEEKQMFLSTTYRQKVNFPDRKVLSFRTQDDLKLKVKPIKIVYHCLAKPIIRRRTKDNQKVAFMSGVPRWKEEQTSAFNTKRGDGLIIKPKKKPPPKDAKKKKVSKYSKIGSRLNYIPERFKDVPMIMREKYFTFTNIPKPKILIRTNEIGHYGNKLLPFHTKQATLESYFTPIY